MPSSDFVCQRRVEFSDTDMGGICHFGRFLIFMETAEHEFLRSLGTSVHREHDGQKIGWPRVAASVDFRAPAFFGEVLDIHVSVLRKGGKSMTYGFRVERDGKLLAEGRMTSVCCILDHGEGPRAVPIPGEFSDLIDDVLERRDPGGTPSQEATGA